MPPVRIPPLKISVQVPVPAESRTVFVDVMPAEPDGVVMGPEMLALTVATLDTRNEVFPTA